MKGLVIALVVVVVLVAALGSSYVGRRNEMVTMQEAIRSSWAQVDVALERRADLIP
jgi:LemA protein